MWSSCLQRGVLRTKTAATNDSIQPVKPESKADELAHMVNILSTYKLFGVRYYHPVISEQEEACVISLRQSNQREAFGSMLQSALEHRCVALPDRNVKEVVVSMFSIEGTTEYVSGLRFVFERYHEEVAIGYIGGEGTNLLFEPAQPLHQLTATFHGRGFVNIVINNLGPDVGRGFVDTENNKQGQEIETISMNLQGKRSLMALLDGSRIIALAVSPVSVLK
ncbi:hypothetical protein ColTof4_01293 [Colletotrichum tofieldiae]|nr:hypothetical protein ColTof3_08540 [Colletotrichum tofieldiae]GKT68870.1 hypothetical protein ColTof4_01293 [Colletotrichum tofieldiae]